MLYRVVKGASPERVVLNGAVGLLPDFLAAAEELKVPPNHAVVFELDAEQAAGKLLKNRPGYFDAVLFAHKPPGWADRPGGKRFPDRPANRLGCGDVGCL